MQIRFGPPPLPREHGAWAMLLTPPILVMLTIGPDGKGLLATFGWIFAYALRGPLEVLLGRGASGRAGMAHGEAAVARFWLLLFGALAVALLLPVVLAEPQTLLLLAGAGLILSVVFWLAQHGLTRSLRAGLLAVIGLMAGAPLYYLAATGQIPAHGWALTYAAAAFFGGSVFRVKSLARERRSATFRWLSVAIHLGFVVIAALLTPLGWAPGLLWLCLVPSLLFALYGAWRGGNGSAANLGSVGKAEVWFTLLFSILLLLSLHR